MFVVSHWTADSDSVHAHYLLLKLALTTATGSELTQGDGHSGVCVCGGGFECRSGTWSTGVAMGQLGTSVHEASLVVHGKAS